MAAPMLRERAAPDAAGMASRYARTMSIAADIHPLLSSAVVATDVDGPNPLLDELRELAVRMADSMLHRGPDGGGAWADAAGGVGL